MFRWSQKVLFKHCDPAGIVFYPRYFEMINDCVEIFFDQALDWPFEDLHQTGGVPTARIETDFSAPSRHGDHLDFTLSLTRIGASSISTDLRVTCGDEPRLQARSVLVYINSTGRPQPWPDAIRPRLQQYMKETT